MSMLERKHSHEEPVAAGPVCYQVQYQLRPFNFTESWMVRLSAGLAKINLPSYCVWKMVGGPHTVITSTNTT